MMQRRCGGCNGVVSGPAFGPDGAIGAAQFTQEEFLASGLTRQEAYVLWARYCSGDWPSFQEVGNAMQRSRARIQQIEAKALRRLRHYKRREFIGRPGGAALYEVVLSRPLWCSRCIAVSASSGRRGVASD